VRRIVLSTALLAALVTSVVTLPSSAFASSAAATKTKTTTYTLNCDTGIASGTVSVASTVTYPASVAPGAKFKIEWASVTTVGGALASAAYAIAPGGTEDGTVTTDTYLSSDATPATKNIAGSGLAESGTISSPNGFPIYTPVTGTYTTPSFKAGSAGTDKVSAQDDDANITIKNSSGGTVTTTTADCTPVGTPAVIAKIKVT
jgi:hypothetical protein